ncbi:hypothetical protein GCK32_010126, partial [Trichostrongylus colubriformis]
FHDDYEAWHENTFCEINSSSVQVEPQSLKTLVNVGRPAQQIIFDPDRVHYVVVDYDPQSRIVVLYDSLVEKDSNVTNLDLFISLMWEEIYRTRKEQKAFQDTSTSAATDAIAGC